MSVNSTTNRGIAISEIAIRDPSMLLYEYAYDEAHCDATDERSLGRLTTTRVFDEASRSVAYERQFCFDQEEGLVSRKTDRVDWDRDGAFSELTSHYSYNDFGQLETEVLPHLPSDPHPRMLTRTFAHGSEESVALTHKNDTVTIIGDVTNPGFEYNTAGGVELIRHGNGTVTTVTPNGAYLPAEITTDDASGTELFSTGTYVYDGVRNIMSMGADQYRYDAVGRLVHSQLAAAGDTHVLDYDFDVYGNMLSRSIAASAPPVGVAFSGRTYSDNRITDTGYEYDPNGNLVGFPVPTSPTSPDQAHTYTPENRMTQARLSDSGTVIQEARYDSNGDRFVRVVTSSSDGGRGLVTIRNAAGEVITEYEDVAATSGLIAKTDYVRAGGRLVASRTQCGPPPTLRVDEIQPDNNYLRLTKIDHVPQTGDARLLVSDGVTSSSIEVPAATSWPYDLPITQLSYGHNTIRLKTEAECGNTDWGNAVSANRGNSGGGGCLELTSLNHDAYTSGVATVEFQASNNACDSGTVYGAYYVPEGGSTPIPIASNLPKARFTLPQTPKGAGHGTYYFAAYPSGGGRGGGRPYSARQLSIRTRIHRRAPERTQKMRPGQPSGFTQITSEARALRPIRWERPTRSTSTIHSGSRSSPRPMGRG